MVKVQRIQLKFPVSRLGLKHMTFIVRNCEQIDMPQNILKIIIMLTGLLHTGAAHMKRIIHGKLDNKMKKGIKSIFFGALIIIFFGASKCELSMEPRKYAISMVNKSNSNIGYYYARKGEYGDNYPDSLPRSNDKVVDELNNYPNSVIFMGRNPKEFFDRFLPRDTLFLFVFSTDTLNKYSWQEIRDGYKILKRYDLSLQDLKEMNFKIIYP